MSKFVVAGITQIETIVKVEKIPVEYRLTTAMPNSIHTSAGGDAYNESLALTWLGNDVKFFSIVGKNIDDKLINPPDRKITLNTEHMLPLLDETPMVVILYDEERRQQIFEDIKNLREVAYDMVLADKAIADCDMVVLANANFCRPFAAAAQKAGKKIAVNIRSFRRDKEQFNTDFLSAANVLYFSDDALEEDPYDFIKSIEQTYGTDIIILGQGAEGLILFDREKDIIAHYNTVKTNEVVNTAGAGNALISCFLHFYLETGDSVAAVKNALLFASYKIGYMGTSNGFMTPEQVAQWRNLIWGIRGE
ncbi:MAG: carbohydrate kinase family protein [Lachnospiraceae bacterium]|nr:carbohydrate kinase family protein [Lachnospiraceae bacterium]